MRLYGYQYTKIWRKASLNKNNRFLFLYYGFKLYRRSLRYGFQISPYASIGKGLYIGHFGTVIVGNEVVIGNNVNLSPNVVIGHSNRGEKTGSPTIGNDVWIGSGSIIVGNIKIGDDVLIAPNSYVNIDVPSHSIVIGNPAVIKSSEYATVKYVCNKVE
jgi:serine O-acetyltransferase